LVAQAKLERGSGVGSLARGGEGVATRLVLKMRNFTDLKEEGDDMTSMCQSLRGNGDNQEGNGEGKKSGEGLFTCMSAAFG
jgi:hypothetical protein